MSFVSRTWLAGSDLGGPALPFHAPMVRPKPCPTWSNFHPICFMLELKGMARSVANLSLRWNSTKVFSSKKLNWRWIVEYLYFRAVAVGTMLQILLDGMHNLAQIQFCLNPLKLNKLECLWVCSHADGLCPPSFVAIFFRHPAAGFLVCPSFVAILFLGTL